MENLPANPPAHSIQKPALALPLAFAAGIVGVALTSPVRHNASLLAAFLGAAAVLLVWQGALFLWTASRGRKLALDVNLRKQHYVQACAQLSVLLYWGWYWPQVYASWPLILAQVAFACGFDMLLAWSRRGSYTLGFGPVPVVFSINLFLWFKPEWFYLQFAMVALGLVAKDSIRWRADATGARRHIFNPSSFPLAVFSVALLAAGASGATWGQEIATTQFYPPQMYLMLFLVGLPGQFFFGVTTMTASAVTSAFLFSWAYFAATGIYFFYDSHIPIAVFLGMHLLFNDPSTSPRTELGRIVYGALYGLSVAGLYVLLGNAGMPTFYDKLLPVPLLNLSIHAIDRAARSPFLRWLDPAKLGASLSARRRNLAYMSVWAFLFGGLSLYGGLNDNHPGQWLPFWRQACAEGRAYACPYLADVEETFCRRGSSWACNEAGLLHVTLAQSGEDLRRVDAAGAANLFDRGCELGLEAACRNGESLARGDPDLTGTSPTLDDLPIILEGAKDEIRERDPSALYALACRQGWKSACESPYKSP